VITIKARRDRLDAAIDQLAADSEFTPLVHRLACLRGISTLTAFALAVEIGDWTRFTGNNIGSFVGLVPANTPPARAACRARSPRPATPTSGGCSSRPPGTTVPDTHRARYCVSAGARPARGPSPWRCRQPRLHQRWITFNLRRKRPVIANVAIARELAGWCWSLAMLDDQHLTTTTDCFVTRTR